VGGHQDLAGGHEEGTVAITESDRILGTLRCGSAAESVSTSTIAHRADLIALAKDSRATDPVDQLEGHLPEGHARILQAVSEARARWTWEPQVVPGPLQVEEYTRSLLQRGNAVFVMPAAEVERRVETWQLRQSILTRTPRLELSFVVDESVLLRRFADPAVMRDQLTHLSQISEQPNIELLILPLDGKQVIGTGAFIYFSFPRIHGVSFPDTVAFEHLQGTTFVDDERDVNFYQMVFSALRASALDAQASRDKIANMARDQWQ
jgi:hypothetical protein